MCAPVPVVLPATWMAPAALVSQGLRGPKGEGVGVLLSLAHLSLQFSGHRAPLAPNLHVLCFLKPGFHPLWHSGSLPIKLCADWTRPKPLWPSTSTFSSLVPCLGLLPPLSPYVTLPLRLYVLLVQQLPFFPLPTTPNASLVLWPPCQCPSVHLPLWLCLDVPLSAPKDLLPSSSRSV